jgi:hypothetical protein
MPDGFRFRVEKGTPDRDVERAAVRRALDFVATFLSESEDDPTVEEFERLLNDDR